MSIFLLVAASVLIPSSHPPQYLQWREFKCISGVKSKGNSGLAETQGQKCGVINFGLL